MKVTMTFVKLERLAIIVTCYLYVKIGLLFGLCYSYKIASSFFFSSHHCAVAQRVGLGIKQTCVQILLLLLLLSHFSRVQLCATP